MKKLSFLIIVLIFNSLFSFGQEAIYAVVQNDTVTIWHVETERNCASAYKMEFEIDGTDINLYEVDTVGPIALCLCYFDLSATLTDLAPGNYNVDVYSVGDWASANDTTFWGSTGFTILSGDGLPQLISNSQSDCYDLTSIADHSSTDPVLVYPNPAEGYIYFNSKNDYVQVQIRNTMGQIVIGEENFKSKSKINISGLQAGIYFITIKSSGFERIEKFIKR
jgi:hypothetical protein